jgi:hypothetical protein
MIIMICAKSGTRVAPCVRGIPTAFEGAGRVDEISALGVQADRNINIRLTIMARFFMHTLPFNKKGKSL